MTQSATYIAIKQFCDLWAQSFSASLALLKIAAPVAEASDPALVQAPTPQEFEDLVCIRFSAGGALRGEILWVAEKSGAHQLAQLLKSEPANPSAEFAEPQREAFAEFLRQVASQTAASWIAQSGSQVEFVFQQTVEPAPVTAQSSVLKLAGEQFAEMSLRLFLNEELCAALSSLPSPDESQTQDAKTSSFSPPAMRTTPLPANLGLVLDVELEATIRFGERQMLLRDIFGLMVGAVVELDQLVNEPAELLVAGRLVARGEVVVVDGNFGMRVTEVASVNERAAAIQLPREG
ncbi:MAG: FliM/FliN family flagellar motor switch protein [Candidatus Acidiferrum sp.]